MKPRMSLDLIVVFRVLDTRWLGNRMAVLDMGWLVLGYNGPLGYTVICLIDLIPLTNLYASPQL